VLGSGVRIFLKCAANLITLPTEASFRDVPHPCTFHYTFLFRESQEQNHPSKKPSIVWQAFTRRSIFLKASKVNVFLIF
jgi:hypothetical protein